MSTEVATSGRGQEGVHDLPVGERVLARGLHDLRAGSRGQLARGRKRGVQHRGDGSEVEPLVDPNQSAKLACRWPSDVKAQAAREYAT